MSKVKVGIISGVILGMVQNYPDDVYGFTEPKCGKWLEHS